MKTRIVIAGGFLGAGKTTLLLRAAQQLVERGYRVGLVTNDQGSDLVDTALGNAQDMSVTEVAGGCFCCRFPDLLTSLQHLQETVNPHIILAEPVGSCTDLVATVLRPLVQFYGEQYELAPLTVLLDSSRTLDEFAPDIRYLYQQQLAEAELILLSKSDLLNAHKLAAEETAHQLAFPQAQTLSVSALGGHGLDRWLDIILGQRSANPEALQIDYDRYAEAEAALGWLNAKGQVRADQAYSFQRWTTNLLTHLKDLCRKQNSPIAHVKAMVTNPLDHDTRVKASLVQSASSISWDIEAGNLEGTAHQFILNARINTTPDQLEQIMLHAIERAKPNPSSRYYLEHFECFSPLPPEPHHRL